LSGTGHFLRSLALARAAGRDGHQVLLINGGRPLAHIDSSDVEISQLPPLTVRDLDFKTLRDVEGSPADTGYLAARSAQIRSDLAAFRPDCLVTETYPFGRRMLSAEFEAAIQAAAAPAIASIRDIPEPKPARLEETASRLRTNYAGVIVHGDRAVLPLDESWPMPEELQSKIHHSGYLSTSQPGTVARGGTILVSVGGGDLGRRLLDLAARAAENTPEPWHLLIGGPDAVDVAQQIRRHAPGLKAEPARRDYPDLLARAGCSVSLAGYNTVLDLAQCATPALLVPSEAGGEREQSIRAARFAQFDGIETARLADLTPANLAETARRLASGPPRRPLPLDLDNGAAAIAALARFAGAAR
ncbi:MAG: glycosyltransferase, partial [Pseudomonadota bacterium]